ncbi:hypothetical protein ACFQAT_28815 [Undibacterium arcticum]|uniref:DUF3096 domain-containing protein n=1 Tax=Undibacterium arcticum TaxID=1762892 RepID=A0ABV7F7J6_9BURK
MTIFLVLIVAILAPLLKRFAKYAAFALVFPLALLGFGFKALFSPSHQKAH